MVPCLMVECGLDGEVRGEESGGGRAEGTRGAGAEAERRRQVVWGSFIYILVFCFMAHYVFPPYTY